MANASLPAPNKHAPDPEHTVGTWKVFVSYDYDNDAKHKNLLLAWAKNSDFAFSMNDQSVDIDVESHDSAEIKRVISAAIGAAPYFLCLVGEETHKNKWVAWEIAKAVELEKRLVAVKIDAHNESPAGLLNQGASWVLSFTLDGITKAIDAA